jgi:hypothetical protein
LEKRRIKKGEGEMIGEERREGEEESRGEERGEVSEG